MDLQKSFEKSLEEILPLTLRKLIDKKLRAAGIDPAPALVSDLAAHVLSGDSTPIQWDDGNTDSHITLSISEEDVADLESDISRLLGKLPDVIEAASMKTAKAMLRTLKNRWAEEHSYQEVERHSFCTALEERWGKPLGMLRMLLTISRELGSEIVKVRPLDESHLSNVLLRLHVRACQVTAEIITLLENGYADGAMARWRTLHEISIVMLLMNEHGEAVAERYVAHQAIEAKSAKDQYQLCHEQLGYQPLSQDECRDIDAEYNEAIAEFGKEFGGPYGWAAGYVEPRQRGRLGLGDLESAAGRSAMASHYKLASHNVHAGPQALFFRLGLLDDEPGLLAGASNVGLAEPGQNAALSLALISMLLFNDSVDLDSLVKMKLLLLLRDQIPPLFFKAERELQADHRRLSRTQRRKRRALERRK